MSVPRARVAIEHFVLRQPFAIARGTKSEANVVTLTLHLGDCAGRGECVPYARYGESVADVAAQLRALPPEELSAKGTARLPLGAARNALDCALWDLAAKQSGHSVADKLGTPQHPLETAVTVSLGTPEAMAAAAHALPHRLLKLKLGAAGDAERLAAVRVARPDARLLVDANEGWCADGLPALFAACVIAGVELIEQPLPAGEDEVLGHIARPVPVCADESMHGASDIAGLVGRYDAVNVKLDKAGGLTGAIAAIAAARAAGLRVMVGCMVGSSLAMAPAWYAAQGADWVDLDGALLIAQDRAEALPQVDAWLPPPPRALWG